MSLRKQNRYTSCEVLVQDPSIPLTPRQERRPGTQQTSTPYISMSILSFIIQTKPLLSVKRDAINNYLEKRDLDQYYASRWGKLITSPISHLQPKMV